MQHMDLSHIAIVGFDIGASSAMMVAGEAVPNVSIAGLPIHVGGVIALSPYADFSGSALDVRYRNINMPVLSITSDADSDANGSFPPSLHQAPSRPRAVVHRFCAALDLSNDRPIGTR